MGAKFLVLVVVAGLQVTISGCAGQYDEASLPQEDRPAAGFAPPPAESEPAAGPGDQGPAMAGAGGPASGGAFAGATPPGQVGGPAEGPGPEQPSPARSGRPTASEGPPVRPTRRAPAGSAPGGPSLKIDLDRGIALPQTGPEGIMMGFHLEYQLTRGRPEPGRRYFLVIRRARGAPIRQAVELAEQGSWEGFAVGWRPEEGPFEAHVEDDRGHRVSGTLPLR